MHFELGLLIKHLLKLFSLYGRKIQINLGSDFGKTVASRQLHTESHPTGRWRGEDPTGSLSV